MFAWVRAEKFRELAYLEQQGDHAARTAPTAATRPGAERGRCLYWSLSGGEPRDIVADFREHKRQTGARERKGAALGLHLLVGVSVEWAAELGDVHDRFNPRVQRLFEQAMVFGRSIGGLYAARMDLDERGSGVVDLFLAPIHNRQARLRKDGKRGPDVPEISVKEALHDLQRRAKGGRSYAALQTLWAAQARENLDPRIIRGVPGVITMRQHLSVSKFREAAEETKRHDRRRAGERELALNTLAFIGEEQDRLRADEKALETRKRDTLAWEASLAAREADLRRGLALLADARREIHRDATKIAEERNGVEVRAGELLSAEYDVECEREELDAAWANLQDREDRIADGEANVAAAREDIHKLDADLTIREQVITASEAKLAAEQDIFNRRAETFSLQRYAYESDLDVKWSQVASASAEADGRHEVEMRKLAAERADLEARIDEAARREARRAVELDGRAARLRAVEVGVAEVAALQEKRAAGIEEDRQRITQREADRADAEAALHSRETAAREAMVEARAVRAMIERDRDDLVDDVGRLASAGAEPDAKRARSGWVVEAAERVANTFQEAVRKTSTRAADAERKALDRERAAAERMAANAEKARELWEISKDLKTKEEEIGEKRRELDREAVAAQDRIRQRNVERDALRAGLHAIENGELDRPEKFAARTDLAPVEPVLQSIVATIGRRVDQLTQSARAIHETAEKRIAQAREAVEKVRRLQASALAREEVASERERTALGREDRSRTIFSAARRLDRAIEEWLPTAPRAVRDAVAAFRHAMIAKAGKEIGE